MLVMRRSRLFSWVEGGSRPDGQKTVWTCFFVVFFSPQLILQFTEGSGPMVLLQRKLYTFPRIQRCPTFSRGWPNFFPGGVQMLISKETHITCDSPPHPSGSELASVYHECCIFYTEDNAAQLVECQIGDNRM